MPFEHPGCSSVPLLGWLPLSLRNCCYCAATASINGILWLSPPTLHSRDDRIVLNFALTQAVAKPNGDWKSMRCFYLGAIFTPLCKSFPPSSCLLCKWLTGVFPFWICSFGLNPVTRPTPLPPRRRLTLNWCHLIDTSEMQIVPVWGKRLHFASGFDKPNRSDFISSQIALATSIWIERLIATAQTQQVNLLHTLLVRAWRVIRWERTCKTKIGANIAWVRVRKTQGSERNDSKQKMTAAQDSDPGLSSPTGGESFCLWSLRPVRARGSSSSPAGRCWIWTDDWHSHERLQHLIKEKDEGGIYVYICVSLPLSLSPYM